MKLIITPASAAEKIMKKDHDLLQTLDPNGSVILHLYDWRAPSATYGYFVKIDQLINLASAKKMGVQFAKRPTGGGVIFHIFDLAFSLLIPKNHPKFCQKSVESYRQVNKLVASAIASFLPTSNETSLLENEKTDNAFRFCMATPTKYDLIYQDKKIVGAAQRRKNNGFLHQGSISLIPPDLGLLQDILFSSEILEAIATNSYPLFGEKIPQDLVQKIEKLKKLLNTTFLNYYR